MFQRAALITLAAALICGGAAAKDGVKWDVEENFKNKDARKNISGAVCAGEQPEWCYAVNDETRYIHSFFIEDREITPGKRLGVLDDGNAPLEEPDLEAIDYFDGHVYLVGSHGRTRTTAEVQLLRYFVFRFPVNATTGAPTFSFKRKTAAGAVVKTSVLKDVIEADPTLSDFTALGPNDNGVNIEGASLLNGDMFFGFRAPVLAEGAVAMQVPLAALFDGAEAEAETHVLDLGPNYGVRDLARWGGELLILAGAGGLEDLPPVIWRWRPGSAPRLLKVIRAPAGAKAEALTPLDADGETLRALVWFDGEKNGAPTEIELILR